MTQHSSKRLAFLAASAAVALNFSVLKATANTIETITENGTSSGLTGVTSGQQESKDTDGGGSDVAPDITTLAYFFPSVSTTDNWGGDGGNGWVVIENSSAKVVEVVQFDNVTDIGGMAPADAFETMYIYNSGDLPPVADYNTGTNTQTITETNGVATYDPTGSEPGSGYDASGVNPVASSNGPADQVDFNFIVPDAANTLCLLGVALIALAGIRRKVFAC